MNQSEREKLYTLRWYLRERWGTEDARQTSLEILGHLLEPEAQPDVRPSASGVDQKLLRCPIAETNYPKARTVGSYRNGYPEGAIVHCTAGRHHSLADEMPYQVDNGFTYFVIDADGRIAQNFPLDSWGNHAGVSQWPGLGNSVSSKLVGIEVQNGGKLTRDGNQWKRGSVSSSPVPKPAPLPTTPSINNRRERTRNTPAHRRNRLFVSYAG